MPYYLLSGIILFLATAHDVSGSTSAVPLSDSVYVTADTNPYFPGCSDELSTNEHNQCSQKKLFQWVSQNLIYPPEARELGIQGSVIMSFVVNANGRMTDVAIVKNPGGGLGEEAKRILELMRSEVTWAPATKDNKAVRFRYIMPIKFRLGDTKETYLVFKAWGGREVFRGMVDVNIQDNIPYKMIKNIETLDYERSKIIYDVIGKVNIIHFRPKKLARPQELVGLKPSNIDKMPFTEIETRFVSALEQLNISVGKVEEEVTYYVHSYIGEVFSSGTIQPCNGTIEKVKLPETLSGVLFVSFEHADRYYTSLFVKP